VLRAQALDQGPEVLQGDAREATLLQGHVHQTKRDEVFLALQAEVEAGVDRTVEADPNLSEKNKQ